MALQFVRQLSGQYNNAALLALILFAGLQVKEVFQFHAINHHSEFNI